MHIIRHPSFRWVICLGLLVLMGYQLWNRSNHFQSFNVVSWQQAGWYLALAALLMPVNWWLETLKWHSYLSVHSKVSFQRAFTAVTSGIALSLFTPNRIGEYGGRILFMPYSIRWPVVFSTLMGSISQNLVAFSTGLISFILLFENVLFLKILGSVLLVGAAMCYFNIRTVIRKICALKWHRFMRKLADQLSYLEDYDNRLLFKTLGIAALRYLVYTFQFVLLLMGLEPDASVINVFMGISCLYFFQTLVPMPPVADVLARTNLALILWAGTGMSELSISLASFIVWVINLLIPALLGSLALGTINLKKSFNTHDPHLSPSYEPVVPDQTNVK